MNKPNMNRFLTGITYAYRRNIGWQDRTIRTLLDAGLTTRTIAQLLPCVRLIGGQAVPCSDLLADLHHERRRIEDHIAALTTSQRILDTVIAAAEPSVLEPPG